MGVAGFPSPAGSEGLLRALEQEIAQLFEENRTCVVRIHAIYAPDGSAGESLQYGSGYTHGTGFVFDPEGFVMTVDKAVAGAREIRVTLMNGQTHAASLVASDPASDVAVIHVDAEGLTCVDSGDSDDVRVGHYSFILGNAFGHLMPSIGTVYEVSRDEGLIQLASTVHPSYGGAPVFNSEGDVLGMVWATPFQPEQALSSILNEAPVPVFVLPINRAKRIAQDLVRQGVANHGWLGVEVDERSGAVIVTRVAEEGPAWKAGIRPEDRILSFDGETVIGPYHLRRMVMETSPGTSVQIWVLKGGHRAVAAEVKVKERGGSDTRRLSDFESMSHSPAAKHLALGVDSRNGDPRSQSALFQKIRAVEQELGRLRQLINR